MGKPTQLIKNSRLFGKTIHTVRRKCIHIAMGDGGAVAFVQLTKKGYKVSYLEARHNLNGWEQFTPIYYKSKSKAVGQANRMVG